MFFRHWGNGFSFHIFLAHLLVQLSKALRLLSDHYASVVRPSVTHLSTVTINFYHCVSLLLRNYQKDLNQYFTCMVPYDVTVCALPRPSLAILFIATPQKLLDGLLISKISSIPVPGACLVVIQPNFGSDPYIQDGRHGMPSWKYCYRYCCRNYWTDFNQISHHLVTWWLILVVSNQ